MLWIAKCFCSKETERFESAYERGKRPQLIALMSFLVSRGSRSTGSSGNIQEIKKKASQV